MNSTELIGNCRKTFNEYMKERDSLALEIVNFFNSDTIEFLRMDTLEYFLQTTKAYHWKSYYHGWLNGRLEMLQTIKRYEAILDQVQQDLADLQNNPDESWALDIREPNNPLGLFYDRMCANVTDYESLNQTE